MHRFSMGIQLRLSILLQYLYVEERTVNWCIKNLTFGESGWSTAGWHDWVCIICILALSNIHCLIPVVNCYSHCGFNCIAEWWITTADLLNIFMWRYGIRITILYVRNSSWTFTISIRDNSIFLLYYISITIATKLYRKHITRLSPLALLLVLRTHNNTTATN